MVENYPKKKRLMDELEGQVKTEQGSIDDMTKKYEKELDTLLANKTKEVEQFVRIINERKMKMKKEFEIARHR